MVALDEEREWYRCHRLLRDALLVAQRLGGRTGEGDVLRRAARWFEEQGRIDDAVRHLLAAGDAEAAAELLTASSCGSSSAGLGRHATWRSANGCRSRPSARQLALDLGYAADMQRSTATGSSTGCDVCDRQIDC